MVPVNTELSKICNVVKNKVVKKYGYDNLVYKVNVIDSSGFTKKTDYDAKINENNREIPSIAGLVTTPALIAVDNKCLKSLIKKEPIMMQKYQILSLISLFR